MKKLSIIFILFVFYFNTASANRPQCQNLFTLSSSHIVEKTIKLEFNAKKIKNLNTDNKFRFFAYKTNVNDYFKNVIKFVKQISNNEIVTLVTHFIQHDQGFIDQPVTRFEDYRLIHLKMILIDYVQNKHLNKEKDTQLWTEQYLKFFIPSHILLEANQQVLLTGNFEFRVLGTALIVELLSRRNLTNNEELIKHLMTLSTRAASRQQTTLLNYSNNYETQVTSVQIMQIPVKQNQPSMNNSTKIEQSSKSSKDKNSDGKKTPEQYLLIINNYLKKSINDPFLYQELLSIQLNQNLSMREKAQLISRKYDYSERIKKHEEAEQRMRLSKLKPTKTNTDEQSHLSGQDLNINDSTIRETQLIDSTQQRNEGSDFNIDSALKRLFYDYPELTYSTQFWEQFDQLQVKNPVSIYSIAKELRQQSENIYKQNKQQQESEQLITFTKSAEKEAAHISDHTLKKHLSEFLEVMKSKDWREYFEHDKRWDYHQHSHPHPIYGEGVRTVDAGRKGTRIVFRVLNKHTVIILGINADKVHVN